MTGIDEDDLDEELAELQQEELDNKMLKTGTVPVSDEVTRLPTVVHGERTFHFSSKYILFHKPPIAPLNSPWKIKVYADRFLHCGKL